jgi:hypothetical protein
MKPYYADESVTLYHGDCREVAEWLAADVLVVDPPYGVGMQAFADELDVAVQAIELSEARLAAIFASPRTVFDLAAHLSTWHPNRLLWMHKTADMAAPWRGWCMNSEAVVVASRPGAHWPKPQNYRSDVYSVGPWERTGHPCGKPLAVVRDLVTRLAEPGAVVADPFAGSGTTLRAAKDQGRRAIGVEIEERYCEIAAERLAQDCLDFGDAA